MKHVHYMMVDPHTRKVMQWGTCDEGALEVLRNFHWELVLWDGEEPPTDHTVPEYVPTS